MTGRKSRIGEEKIMHNGQKATIVDGSGIVTIEFEDGYRTTVSYQQFKTGHVKNPNLNASLSAPTVGRRLGQEIVQHNKLSAKVIAVHPDNLVDIEWEDGYISPNVRYYQFVAKNVGHPLKFAGRSCLGETKVMRNGLKATVINYVNAKCIDVEFENGVIVRDKLKCQFDRGTIGLPKDIRKTHRVSKFIGEKNVNNLGEECEIVEYNTANDITVRFENGETAKTTYPNFKSGSITRPNYYKDKLMDKTVKMSNGQTAKVIGYRSAIDIDVEFEDGTVVKNVAKNNFMRGLVENPNCSAIEAYRTNKSEKAKSEVLGKTVKLNSGHTGTCIGYNGVTDLTIQLDDGTILYHKSKVNFLRGQVADTKKRNLSK